MTCDAPVIHVSACMKTGFLTAPAEFKYDKRNEALEISFRFEVAK